MRTDESGHEDIMKEAVSLINRIELNCPTFDDPVVLGLNNQGWLFVYLGSDPMYRFDEQGRLRRAFVDGYLYRTSGMTLSRLERQGNAGDRGHATTPESVLLRQDLTPNELRDFRDRTLNNLTVIQNSLPSAAIVRQHAETSTDLRELFTKGLNVVLGSTQFLAPAIVRR